MTGHRDERGSVTAEFAVIVPAVVMIIVLTVATLAGASRQIRLEQAAAQAARLASRGETDARVHAALAQVGGDATVRMSDDGDLVCAEARVSVPVPLPLPPMRAVACAAGDGR
ncbi:TadE family type IV pilus minor pilin [Microbacterium invictum]|uniref:Flp pilus assembly pilin Flp n=1 Tax=Microbacterium invictum TaxID=515415 RepID=A0AA40SLJ0_9MICO|nr:TadE family type IV pilus minor pilin [Microbacterium invictum]MBB4138448.1 Flp pilus assembly pilin Flp [Microbacterium invictum]